LKVICILRSVIGAILFAVMTFLFSTSAILFSLLTTSTRIPRLHVKWWGILSCWLFGVSVEVLGKDHWRRDSGGVVLFNHTSFFDIFAMAGYLPDMRFGAKIELFKIPIFGEAMKRIGILPIDRGRREKVFAVYQKSLDRLTAGEKIALAPEGTRTSNPQHLSPFKSGPFIFALQSKVDLIPVVIQGAYEVFPKGQLLPNTDHFFSKIHLHVLPPISTMDQDFDKRASLQSYVRAQMQSVLDAKRKRVGAV
jgi:1-acyl-sn-glycerol-3-phosphate acyltransferase